MDGTLQNGTGILTSSANARSIVGSAGVGHIRHHGSSAPGRRSRARVCRLPDASRKILSCSISAMTIVNLVAVAGIDQRPARCSRQTMRFWISVDNFQLPSHLIYDAFFQFIEHSHLLENQIDDGLDLGQR